jgi:ribonuclease HII
VVAAAVILSEDGIAQLTSAGVKDSKKLTPRVRSRLATEIKAIAIDCKIGWATVKEIDRFNILQATLLAMKRAILRLNPEPELCLIDGNQKISQLLIPQQTIIKGDSTSITIAAASIVAKVWRDELIIRLDAKYPQYDLKQNKGYGTAKHRQAIQEHGITRQHRQSFGCCQLFLPL